MMKKFFAPIFLTSAIIGMTWSSCEVIDNVLSDADIAEGLKEALRIGSDTAVSNGNALNGYFGNEIIKILLPPEAEPILAAVSLVGGQGVVDEVVLKINRAAEEAAIEATPILIDAITSLTITDALTILNGADDAATQYLDEQTSPAIFTAFKPKIETALTSVGAQLAWEAMTDTYNQIPLVPDVDTDLAAYTTEKAQDGLMVLVADEEKLIRNDVNHQVSQILQDVFGGN